MNTAFQNVAAQPAEQLPPGSVVFVIGTFSRSLGLGAATQAQARGVVGTITVGNQQFPVQMEVQPTGLLSLFTGIPSLVLQSRMLAQLDGQVVTALGVSQGDILGVGTPVLRVSSLNPGTPGSTSQVINLTSFLQLLTPGLGFPIPGL